MTIEVVGEINPQNIPSVVRKMVEFLNKQPTTKVFTSEALASKLGYTCGATVSRYRRRKEFEGFYAFDQRNRLRWGNPKAIQKYREQIKPAA